ncbi:hypothetical protein ACFRAQ_13640 [Nocardia sp. NPDC056611]|uniref:hypothetical protein n=1 Tax=Nocardia sp. NPDC056611 TaxID=3345877 RepID=UPI00366F548C
MSISTVGLSEHMEERHKMIPVIIDTGSAAAHGLFETLGSAIHGLTDTLWTALFGR